MRRIFSLCLLLSFLLGLPSVCRASGSDSISSILDSLEKLVDSSSFGRFVDGSAEKPSAGLTAVSPAKEKENEKPEPKEVPEWEFLDELSIAERLPEDSHSARERAVMGLFIQAGAHPREILSHKIGKYTLHNISVVKRGETNRWILVGAHGDKTPQGAGVFDNWTGSVMVTNLYQSLREYPTRHNIAFVVFSGEEQGLLGSYSLAQSLGPETLARLDAMINMDVLGFGDLDYWEGGSTEELRVLADRTARQHGFELKSLEIPQGANTDSYSFLKLGIPVISFSGIPGQRLQEAMKAMHNSKDRLRVTRPVSYIQSHKALVSILLSIDENWKKDPSRKYQNELPWLSKEDPRFAQIPSSLRPSVLKTAWDLHVSTAQQQNKVQELGRIHQITEDQAAGAFEEVKKQQMSSMSWAGAEFLRLGPEGMDKLEKILMERLNLSPAAASARAKRVRDFIEGNFKPLGIRYDGILQDSNPLTLPFAPGQPTF